MYFRKVMRDAVGRGVVECRKWVCVIGEGVFGVLGETLEGRRDVLV
jgi:hypothetical protein